MRSVPREFSMACPPSMPIRHEILPALKLRSTSAARYAIARSRGYRAHSRLIRSICSRAYTAGCGPESIVVTGTYAAQNWPPTAPARSFGMSVISCGWLTAKSTESSPPRWRIASGMSLWPSMRGTVRRMATARARFVSLCAARRRNDGRTESVSSTSTSPHIPLPSFRPSVAFRMCAPWLQFGPESWRRPARLSRLRLGTMPDTKAKIALELNGEPVEVAFAPHKTLLEVLREDLGLTGTKHGCELGECCTGYIKIYEAVELAAARLRGEVAEPSQESLYGRR